MDILSERIKRLPASATLTMAAKARELKNKGIDVIGLSLGEPDFNTPEFIKDAAIKAVNDNYNSYSPVDGYLDLKKSICKKSNFPMGYHIIDSNPNLVKSKIKEGYSFLAFSTDFLFMGNSSLEMMEIIRK